MLAKASIHAAAPQARPVGCRVLRRLAAAARGRYSCVMDNGGWVYMLASAPRGTLYIGVTSALVRRDSQHRLETYGGFTARYGVRRRVRHEAHGGITAAIAREKALKFWRRAWTLALVEAGNRGWRDPAEDWGFPPLG